MNPKTCDHVWGEPAVEHITSWSGPTQETEVIGFCLSCGEVYNG